MIRARIIKNWEEPNLFRQAPQELGIWGNTQFTFEAITDPDYVLVLNYSPKKIKVKCSKENVWCILQEPPNEYFKYRHKANKVYYRVFTQDQSLKGERYIYSQPALPWHVDKDYDFLKKTPMPNKPHRLSWITSNKKKFQGQKARMRFLEKIKSNIDFDLYGRGFRPLDDKWDGLAPYRYSLAIENFQGPYYWSEKLADCFLSWTVPIYYGCTNITDYFPSESLVEININNPNVIDDIREIVRSNLWEKRREAIFQARDLVLNKYQFFPFMASRIKEWEKDKKDKSKKEEVVIPNENTFKANTLFNLKRIIGRLWLKYP